MDLTRLCVNRNCTFSHKRPAPDPSIGFLHHVIADPMRGPVDFVYEELLEWAEVGIERVCIMDPFGTWNISNGRAFKSVAGRDYCDHHPTLGFLAEAWAEAVRHLRREFREVIVYAGDIRQHESRSPALAFQSSADGSRSADYREDYKGRADHVIIDPAGENPVNREPGALHLAWLRRQLEPFLQDGVKIVIGIGNGFPARSNRAISMAAIEETNDVLVEPTPLRVHGHLDRYAPFCEEGFVDNWDGHAWEWGNEHLGGERVKPEEMAPWREPHLLVPGNVDRDHVKARLADPRGWIVHLRPGRLRQALG